MIELSKSQKTALVVDDIHVSFHDLTARVQKRKKELGDFPGAILVLSASNTIDFVVNVLAALDTRPVAIFSHKWSAAEKQVRLAKLKNYCLLSEDFQSPSAIQNDPVLIDPQTRLILFTSGSSGNPKAVQISAENIEANTKAVIASLFFKEVNTQHLHLPLSYSFGLLGQLFPALVLGVQTHLYQELMELAHLFSDNTKIGMLSAVPEQWQFLTQLASASGEAQTSVSHCVSAGSRLPLALRQHMKDCFPKARLFNNYGMTECSPRILSLASHEPDFFSEAVGRPVQGIRYSFRADGELQIQGPQVMLGYMDDKDGALDRLQDGLLHTGDFGYEKNGVIYLQGRQDDLVKIAGERISSQEVANTIAALPNVRQVCVLPYQDEVYGHALSAFVVLANPDEQGLRTNIAQALSANRRPALVKVLSDLPKNGNGKVDRPALQRLREEL